VQRVAQHRVVLEAADLRRVDEALLDLPALVDCRRDPVEERLRVEQVERRAEQLDPCG
jgi:hypothetical protein